MEAQFFIELVVLALAGFFSFVWSTISGGGGSLLLIPALSSYYSSNLIAPIINLGSFIGRPARLIIFWKEINWSVTWFYVIPAWIAAVLSGFLLATLNLEWLKLLIGIFLISTFWQFRFGRKERSFTMKRLYFAPLGFIVVLLSTLVGGVGPVNNPFYLNYGLDKEALIATKTANSFLVGLVQIGSYSFFGQLSGDIWYYGIALGIGATVGNLFGKKTLGSMKSQTFRQLTIITMVVSGCWMIWKVIQGL